MDYYSSQQMDYFAHHCINGHVAQVLRHLSVHPTEVRKGVLIMAQHGQVACLHQVLQHHCINDSLQKDIFCAALRRFQHSVVAYALNHFAIKEDMVVNSFSWLISAIERSNDHTTNSISKTLLEHVDLQHYPSLFKQVARSEHEFTLKCMLDSAAPKTILPNITDQMDLWPIVFWGCQHFSNQVHPSLIAHDKHTQEKYQRLWDACVVYITAPDLEERLSYESKFRDNPRALFEKAYCLVEHIKRDKLLKIAQQAHTGLNSARKKI
jgi:hypothetical protein